jgi:hypothetical protein
MNAGDPRYARPWNAPQTAMTPHPPGPRPVHPMAVQQGYAVRPAPSAPPPAYGTHPPPPYAQAQQPYPSPIPPAPGFGMNLPPMAMPKAFGNVAEPTGLPAAFAFGLGLAAVVVALVFDVVFLKVHIPGIGGYAWYLTTALSFAGAGYAGLKWTQATQGIAMTAAAVAAVAYGALDLGLGLVLEGLSLGGSIVLAAQGIAIALVCGIGGVQRARREMNE